MKLVKVKDCESGKLYFLSKPSGKRQKLLTFVGREGIIREFKGKIMTPKYVFWVFGEVNGTEIKVSATPTGIELLYPNKLVGCLTVKIL